MLYVPTDQLDNVKKYIGGGDALPKINRLGSKEWENTKERVKKNRGKALFSFLASYFLLPMLFVIQNEYS